MKERKIPKLMVVDVEIDVCHFVKSFFEERDFEVIYAHNSLDALPMVEREKPDVLLLSIKLPGMSGLDALPYIKNINPGTKVLILTSVEDEAKMNEALTRGAEGCIAKPLLLEELLAAINKICPDNYPESKKRPGFLKDKKRL